MTLITKYRPKNWNSIVGQDRAVMVLKSILKTARFMPSGFVFRGVRGVGKTSAAYIMARALMCTGGDPLGCGECLSCTTFDEHGVEGHSDCFEVDAAENSGVENARQLLDDIKHPACTGKRRVIIIDEAHRLSREAWDTYLIPLEREVTDNAPIIQFVSNDGDKIPETITSRCGVIPFFKVDADTITGLLANICNQEKIRYELEGLQIIARMSRGHIRDAISRLETVAAVGGATKALVTSVLDDSLEDLCLKALLAVAMKQLTEAVRYGDEACRSNLPARVIETMFALYARSVFAEGDSQLGLIAAKLADAGEVSAIFLKWSSTPYLSADTIPLLIYELIGTVGSFRERQSGKGLSTPPPLLGQKMTTKDLMDILQAEELKN